MYILKASSFYLSSNFLQQKNERERGEDEIRELKASEDGATEGREEVSFEKV